MTIVRRVPKTFHFTFGLRRQTEPFHLLHYLCLESCLRVNRPDRLLFHYHFEPWGEYWDLIRDRIELIPVERPSFARRFRYSDRRVEPFRYAHESDFIRLDALLEHGGVYADIDTLFVHPIPDVLYAYPFVLGREADVVDQTTGQVRHSLCNAFIMSEPNAEFGQMWRARMADSFDGSWSNHSTFLPWELAQAHPEWIHVEPQETFYGYMWTREDLRRLFEGDEPVSAAVASIHLWAHLWWSATRRDFSDFHAGVVTEERVRRLDTTYNRLARPFLPPVGRSVPAARQIVYRLAWAAAQTADVLSRGSRHLRRKIGELLSRRGGP